MVKGGKAVGKAAAGIIAKAAKKVMPEVAEDALKAGAKDVAKDSAKAVAKDAAKDGAKTAGKDVAKDAGKDAGRQGARDTAKAGQDTAKKVADRTATKDPIDVASGEVLLHQVDVELAGVLPLVLERTHISSYRTGRWFGTSWASTLDQRLEVDEAGACLVSTEGLVLVYPIPMFGEAALPERGPRWPLSFGDGGYTVADPQQGHTLHFASQPNARIPGGRAMVLPLKAIIDRNGNRIDLEYDGEGTLTEVRHSGGYRIGVETTDGRVTALRLLNADDQPVLKRFGYNEAGRLTEVYNASSDRPTRFEYDPAGRMTRWTDTNDHWYAYTYDEQGRGIAGEGSGGYLNATLAYHDRMTVVTDSLGHETTYHFNERGQVTAVVDPLGNTTWSEWDVYGRLLSRTDPLDRTTRYTYDEHGNLTVITRPDGAQVTASYNELHLPTEIVEANDAVWRQAYDERGNRGVLVDPAGATTAYTYDEHGSVIVVTDALGGRTRIDNDGAGLPMTLVDPLGSATRYVRDAFGRLSAITDPVGGVTRFGWTSEGKLAWRNLPNGATERWTYDAEGNLTEHVDALGNATCYEVTTFDQRSAQISSDGARLEFSYDTELRMVAVTNPQGLIWRYDYDAADNLVREIDFNGRELRYEHDAGGQLIERVNGAAEVTRYIRDSLGNVIEKRSGEAVTTFSYDPAGRMVRAVNADADVRFQRDVLGRVVAEVCNGRLLASAYDPLGRRIRRRTPSGAESLWHFDQVSRPVAMRTAGQTLEFAYDAAGREVQRRIGSGAILDQRWDADHRLASQTLWGAPTPGGAGQARLLQHRTYSYRADGNIVGIRDETLGYRHYALDRAGRVTAVDAQGWSERYAYDPAGNLTDAAWPASDGTHDADAIGDREYTGTLIRRAGNVRYEHDAQGRLILRQHRRLSSKPFTWRYTWDRDDRLVAVTTPDGQRWRYRYDALGRRIAKQRLAPDGQLVVEHTDFAWDGTVLAEQADTLAGTLRAMTWEYEPGGFRPISQTERAPLPEAPQQWIDQQFHAIVSDLVGSPSELVDAAGSLSRRYLSTLWGSSVALNKDGHCPLRFPGQYFDAETGLNYNYFRYYDPLSARYGSSDPLGLGPAPDPHAYVSNTTTWSDPLGLSACSTFFSVQNAKDVDRLLEHGGEPWPTGVTNGSLRDIFGPGLYTWETRAQAEGYLQKWESKGATGLNIMEHRISSSDLAGLKSVDLSKIGDDAANKILDLGAGHGYEHIRRITGNYGPESYFSREVFHLFKNGIA